MTAKKATGDLPVEDGGKGFVPPRGNEPENASEIIHRTSARIADREGKAAK